MIDACNRELVEDALYNRRKVSHGCFSSNPAGMMLFRCPETILSDIENVIVSDVIPRFNSNDTGQMQGISFVFGAYLVVGCACEPERVASFLRGLPVEVLVSVLSTIPSVFGPPRGEGYLLHEPNRAVLELLHELSVSNRDEVADLAALLIKRLGEDGYSLDGV